MTLTYCTISQDMLDSLIEHIEETLDATAMSSDMNEYARATGRCRGVLFNAKLVLQAYRDDQMFSLK